MPKATDLGHGHAPVSVEAFHKAKGKDPYAHSEDRRPVAVSLDADIPQFPVPPRFPAPEVMVKCLVRGVEDRGFTFGCGADPWGTTWQRAKELAGKVQIVKILTPNPDADATPDH